MCMCVRVCACVWKMVMRKDKSEKEEKRKRKEREKIEKKQKLIHTDKHTDGQIDTNHSLISDTILNNIVNRIQLSQMELNQFEIK